MAEMTIRRFGVFSVAKMYGLLLFVFGILIGVIYGLMFIGLGLSMSGLEGAEGAGFGALGGVAMGVLFMIGVPIMYGVFGFIGGAIGALVYNAMAGIIGGVKFDLEGVAQEYAPPPPPHQWAPHQQPVQ